MVVGSDHVCVCGGRVEGQGGEVGHVEKATRGCRKARVVRQGVRCMGVYCGSVMMLILIGLCVGGGRLYLHFRSISLLSIFFFFLGVVFNALFIILICILFTPLLFFYVTCYSIPICVHRQVCLSSPLQPTSLSLSLSLALLFLLFRMTQYKISPWPPLSI